MPSCSCDIRLVYRIRKTGQLSYTYTHLLSSAGVSNGYDYFLWDQPYYGETLSMKLEYTTGQWEMKVIASTGSYPYVGSTISILFDSVPSINCPIGTDLDWTIQLPAGTSSFIWTPFDTSLECGNIQVCCQWEITTSTLPVPLNTYIFPLFGYTDLSILKPGMDITQIYWDYAGIEEGIGGYKIQSLIFQSTIDPSVVYYENGSNRVFRGIIICDADGTILNPTNLTYLNRGYVCFSTPTVTQDELNKECFDALVWDKQCEFGQKVYAYLQKLQFGIDCCDDLEELKNDKRALEILNCYDTRDIENNTTQYNQLSYTQIKKLL